MIRPARWLFGLALALGLGAGLRDDVDNWIDATRLPPAFSETSVEMHDRAGVPLRVWQVGDGLWRMAVRVSDVDPEFIAMLVRYEDKRFWQHAGVDPLALLRAAGQALLNGRAVSGGSTLTMQVARLLEDGSTGRWAGKLRQIRVALALERRMDKASILQLYLTNAPYGGNVEGIRAATYGWFGKPPRRLTPAQAALLVALPQSPETRRPDRHPEAARAARDAVLARMVDAGVLSEVVAHVEQRAPLPDGLRGFPRLAAHLGDTLRAEAPGAPLIATVLDARAQAAMEDLARAAARRAGARISMAIMVADRATGDVIASVGSADYAGSPGREGYVDMTRAIRSPGSLLKPVIYGLAFDRGLAHPETIIHDGPVRFGQYAPQNFDGQFRGDIRLREALQQSLNIPVVKLTEALGPARVVAALKRAGAQVRIPGGRPGLAISLGGLGMSLRDLVQLYAALANGGTGPLLREAQAAPRAMGGRVTSPEAAWQVGNILAGLAPPPGAPAGVLAYKTGTSYGHRDAWAIGYDGAHVIGVWMGRPDGTPVPGAFGGSLAAPVLFEAFGRLKPGFDRLPPPPPSTLIVSGADLPVPLRRFEARGAVAEASPPELAFPPDGARVLVEPGAPLTLRLRGGTEPFSVLANGAPVARGVRAREIDIGVPGPGFSTLVVIDGTGRSDRVTIRLD
ncbi:MAG: penicillin-binding protein 1C [Pseudooceanicola sp.]|jgi:penicillin-binding protein 1C|nr:penicillin-binding protein 1C [Pseudooceanicola sp.]